MRRLTKLILVGLLTLTSVVGASDTLLREQKQQQQVLTPSSGPHVSRSMFTTRIANNEPVSDLIEIETDFSTVFFFTELKNCDNCAIQHEWSFNGTPQLVVDGYSKWPLYKFWSSVNLAPSHAGTWSVKMVVEGQLFAEKSFTYYKPTKHQQQNQGIQQRLEVETLSECEENLRYFSDQAKADPDEPYFEFMLEKWGKRCLK